MCPHNNDPTLDSTDNPILNPDTPHSPNSPNSPETAPKKPRRKNKPGGGRPIKGTAPLDTVIKLRIDPYLLKRFDRLCKITGQHRSEALRYAMQLYIRSVEKRMKGDYNEQYWQDF